VKHQWEAGIRHMNARLKHSRGEGEGTIRLAAKIMGGMGKWRTSLETGRRGVRLYAHSFNTLLPQLLQLIRREIEEVLGKTLDMSRGLASF